MITKNIHRICFALFLSCLLQACIEPIELVTNDYKSNLVVEANLTNEIKQHSIFVSRSFRLDEDNPNLVSNAQVEVLDDLQNSYGFAEIEPGHYLSNVPFAALPGRAYQLSLTTSEGGAYLSELETLPLPVAIENIYATRKTNENGKDGLMIFVDNYDPTGTSQYFRYEYEETYKIVAPDWVSYEMYVISEDPVEVDIRPRSKEERVCFGFERSNGILLANTTGFNDNRITGLQVRFVEKNDYILANRYSILVKQYAQSLEAYNYFSTLKAISASENVFSDLQPGFVQGNIRSQLDENEGVIGFFEVSAVTTKRLFVNYKDFFNGSEDRTPDYPASCAKLAPAVNGAFSGDSSPLVQALNSGYKFVENYLEGYPDVVIEGPYILTPAPCGDCTLLGSNVVPDFWEE